MQGSGRIDAPGRRRRVVERSAFVDASAIDQGDERPIRLPRGHGHLPVPHRRRRRVGRRTDAGRWIADRLAPFGPSVGHAVPLGYAAYGVVPVPWDDDADDDHGPLSVIEVLLDMLARFTGGQPVRCGMWDGWSWWYATGTDPRINTGVGVSWPERYRPTQEAIGRARAEAQRVVAALEELACERQAGAVAAEPLGRLPGSIVVGRAGPAGALGGLEERPANAGGPWRQRWPGARRASDWWIVMFSPAYWTASRDDEKRRGSPSWARIVIDVSGPMP